MNPYPNSELKEEAESFKEYFERLKQRTGDNYAREAMCLRVWQFARTAHKHLGRLGAAGARYRRALAAKDEIARRYERDTILALLYEASDTVYITLQILDPNLLRLEASSDGLGITGEDANYVFELLQMLDGVGREIFKLSREYGMELDFKVPVDERISVTYIDHPHWQDFVRGSMRGSFFSYFAHTRKALAVKLAQVPRFWQTQTLRQALLKSNRPALKELVRRLEQAPLAGAALEYQVAIKSEAPPPWESRVWHQATEHLWDKKYH